MIGSESYSTDTLSDNADLNWTTEPFTILGITNTPNLKDIQQLNFDKKKLEGIKKEITQWSKRQISPMGKITIVKSSLLSKFVSYLSQAHNG